MLRLDTELSIAHSSDRFGIVSEELSHSSASDRRCSMISMGKTTIERSGPKDHREISIETYMENPLGFNVIIQTENEIFSD